MSDIEKIRKIEERQELLLHKEKEKAKERISRAEADASFRIGKAIQEQKTIIEDFVKNDMEDALKKVAFVKNENSRKIAETVREEAKNVDRAVEYVLDRVFS